MAIKPENFYNLAMTSADYTDSDANRFIVTESSVYYQGGEGYHAFDPYTTLSEFCPQSGFPQWVQMKVDSPVQIKAFTMYSRRGYTEHVNNFTLQGSNDGVSWDNLGSFSWPEMSSTVLSKDFTVPDYEEFYTYFRWYMTSGIGNYGCIAEIKFTNVVVYSPPVLKPENFYNLAMTANDYTDSDLNRFIVSASSILDAPRQPYRAFDGNYDTLSEWHPTSGVPQWLQMQVEQPVKVLGFRIYSRPGYVEQPTAFKLQGSNDGETWTDLESFTWTETSTSGVHYKDCVVPDNGQFYTYFRWYMTDAVPYSPYCCVNEITFTNVVVFSPTAMKYVFESDSKFYTVVDDAFSEITDVTELTASVFETYGVDAIPDETLLLTLDDVIIHMWTNTDEEVSKKAIMEAVPYPQTLISPNYDMSHPSILGIESAEAVASEDVTIAVSFDDGETWKMYDGSQWIALNVETAGMSATTLNAISTEAWNSVAITGMFKFRITIPDETESFTSLVVDYLQN